MQELDNDRLVWMFTQMLRIREFEERVKRTFEEHPGVIRGHTHLADGAEASIVGSLAAMQPGDQLIATYRCHGYPIALGTDTKAIMAEIYGRKNDLGEAPEMILSQKADMRPEAHRDAPDQPFRPNALPTGVFVERGLPEYGDSFRAHAAAIRAREGNR